MAARVGRRARRAARDARRCAAPRRISPKTSPSWSAPTPSAPTMRANNAVGLLHEEMRRAGSLIMRAADAHKLPAGGALAVDRHGFSAAVHAGAAGPSAGRAAARGDGRPAAGRLGQRDRRHRPAHLAGAGRGDPRAERRGRARLLRRHRPDRASREHRSVDRLEAVALRQGRAGRRRRGLPQLPARARTSTTPSSPRCWPATRPSSRSGSTTRPISAAASRSR